MLTLKLHSRLLIVEVSMNIALYRENIVHLTKIERSQLQTLFLASQRGELTCPCCRQMVKLKISMNVPPYFIHPATTFYCDETISALEQQEQKIEKAIGSFTIPINRSINGSATTTINKQEIDRWRAPYEVKSIPPFQQPTEQQNIHPIYHLDHCQWEAVSTTEGPLLVLAGAGSGKTRVITTRTAYMITEKNVSAKKLLLVTFTTKAAQEMGNRLQLMPHIPKQELKTLLIGTFHSVFYKMLLHHQTEMWQPSNLMKGDWQREQLIKEAAREHGVDEKEFAFDQALSQISYWKNHLLEPQNITAKSEWEEVVKYLYERYEKGKTKLKLFDFDDMLLGCYRLLNDHNDLLEKYQERFSYLLVDEFQDINKVQYEIVSMLAHKQKNICAVGDDDQSIYRFRGSDPSYILNFETDFPNGKTVTLINNYRSHHSIVASAKNVISHNKLRKVKEVTAMTNSIKRPIQFFPYDEEEEATMIVCDIQEKISKGANPRDFVVLFRTNSSARAIFERLVASSLPFSIEQDGDSFYVRRTVRKALAYLKVSFHPDDQEAIRELLGALFLKQDSLRDLKALSILHDCSLLNALEYLKDIQPFQQKKIKKLLPLFSKLRNFSPKEALEWVEKEMGLSDYIKKHGNEGNMIDKGSDDLRDLKVAASSHERITDFLQHVDHIIQKAKEFKRVKTNEGIQLMTVHRAKGLEYKTVYILNVVEGGFPHDYSLESLREGDLAPLEEERRLMYVAITRAMENLYVSVPQKRRGKKAHPSRFIREMNTIKH